MVQGAPVEGLQDAESGNDSAGRHPSDTLEPVKEAARQAFTAMDPGDSPVVRSFPLPRKGLGPAPHRA